MKLSKNNKNRSVKKNGVEVPGGPLGTDIHAYTHAHMHTCTHAHRDRLLCSIEGGNFQRRRVRGRRGRAEYEVS